MPPYLRQLIFILRIYCLQLDTSIFPLILQIPTYLISKFQKLSNAKKSLTENVVKNNNKRKQNI